MGAFRSRELSMVADVGVVMRGERAKGVRFAAATVWRVWMESGRAMQRAERSGGRRRTRRRRRVVRGGMEAGSRVRRTGGAREGRW